MKPYALKRLLLIGFLMFAGTGLSGCFSFIDWDHNKNHMKVWNDDLESAHKSIDRFFFNYDWDDPTRDVTFEEPNIR